MTPLLLAATMWMASLDSLFQPPAELRGQAGKYKSLAKSGEDWSNTRAEILSYWESEIGKWPALIAAPKLEILSATNREDFAQKKIRVEIAKGAMQDGYLLEPKGKGPFPGAVVVYYEPETSVGLTTNLLRDFAYQLTKRGFVTLSIGSPGGDARKPDTSGVPIQPLHYLGYVASNCRNALANLPNVDGKRVGVVGHSYGGKWAMFAAAFNPDFAFAAWSDPGSVFDEARGNINYWEPWYLGLDPNVKRKPGLVTAENPRTGAYKRIYESGHDLHEVMALLAPRPFLISGGSEDPPERWQALNRVNEVYARLGATNRVAMSNRPHHNPTEESNALIYEFFERFAALK